MLSTSRAWPQPLEGCFHYVLTFQSAPMAMAILLAPLHELGHFPMPSLFGFGCTYSIGSSPHGTPPVLLVGEAAATLARLGARPPAST